MADMALFKKQNRIVNIAIDDYVIRMVENTGQALSSIKLVKEEEIPDGLIEFGRIVDEVNFYNFMKKLVGKWGIKKRQVRFYVPNSLVIMRNIEIPSHVLDHRINQHFEMEIGESIHLPFQNPIFDIYALSKLGELTTTAEDETRQGVMFAVPEDEVNKFTEIFVDVSLTPIAADVKELGIYRYFHQMDRTNRNDSYLFIEFNLTSVNLSIFHNHQIEFLRYQPLEIEASSWVGRRVGSGHLNWEYENDIKMKQMAIDEQINELDRIMNFYRYSLHNGEKEVTKVIILGDYPKINEILDKVDKQYQLPTELLDGYLSNGGSHEITTAFIPTLGLALKGASIV